MEGDPCFRGKKISASVFLPTPSAWRATEDGRKVVDCHRRFLPTPSAWRATTIGAFKRFIFVISTHALTWRATLPSPTQSADQRDFYPRPHMEGDALKTYIEGTDFISTHALTWRATRRKIKASVWRLFLPTPSHGGRPWRKRSMYWQSYFYPRPHMEGDSIVSASQSVTDAFLPTPSHGGRRSSAKSCGGLPSVFLPTPSHGGRPSRAIA